MSTLLRLSFRQAPGPHALQTGNVGTGSTLGVVLAAGAGSRFHGPTHKLLAPFRGKRVIDWAIGHAAQAPELDELLVVTGATPRLDLAHPGGTRVFMTVINHDAHRGQATSLHLALAVAEERGHRAIVVGLGDQPLIPASTWSAVARATGTPIAAAFYDGKRRNPVRLAHEVWPLIPRDGDEGARSLFRLRPELVTEVPSVGNPADIDTVEDLRQWNSTTNLS
jgi:molybdenum cofactor cytidylyltransferase